MSTASEFGRGKTIFVLAIVIGCFAVLWPKIFYPMLTASISQTQGDNAGSVCCDVISLKDTNAYEVMNEICANIMRKEQMIQQQQEPRKKSPVKVSTASLCRNEIKQTCGVDIIGLLKEDHSITMEYKKSLVQLRSFNTSYCIKLNYGVDVREIGLPRKFKGPESAPSHMRPERPFRPGPDMVHPALRERGRAIPTVNIPRRTIEREARPGPVPGMRPPVGGAGHIPSAPKGGGTMGIIMPMYTIGIVCFFLYTIMKILFKKNPEAEQPKPAPVVKDYGMDPEHRKFVMSEEYAEGSDRSLKEAFSKEDRDLGLRRRPSGGKSARFYEDRRRLDLETDRETTTSPLTPPDNMAEISTLTPAATQPVTETVDEVVKDDDITIPSASSPLHIEENADTQIQNVTNEPESEPEPLKDQMVYDKLDDENESIIPYSPPLQDESSPSPPTLHDIGIALVHDVVTEAQKFADSIKEIAEIPVALEDDKMASSAATAGETMQNEPEIPLSVEEELKATPPLPLAGNDGEVKPESSKRHELSKEASVCSSADTVIAESVTGSDADVDENAIESVVSSLSAVGENAVVVLPKDSNVAEEISKVEEPELVAETEPQPIVDEPVITITKLVEQAAPPAPRSSEPEIGPLSPLAPEQTPDIESEPSHFFDRTIVIPDYEPEAAKARKLSMQLAQEAAAVAPLPSAPIEPEAEPEAITIVKQDSVPSQVLSLAEQITERILDAAKAELVVVAPTAQDELEVPASPAPPPTPAAQALNEPPSFPILSAEVSKQLEQAPVSPQKVPTTEAPTVVVVVEEKEAQPQQVEVKDDDGQKANRESVVTAVKGIVEAFDAPIVPALSSPFVAPSRSSTTKGTQEAVSQPSQTQAIPPLQPQPIEEDLEKLISGGIEAAKKEDLAGVAAQETQEAQPLKPATKERKSSEKEVKFKLPPEEMEDDEEELEEEVEIVRPPTPPKTLSKLKPKSSAAAAIAAAKAAGSPSPSPSERVSVIGIEETASLISGERWDNRTPTPTFRQPTPPVAHRPPSPPEQIPSIFLEGPMPVRGQEIIVREAQIEVEGGEDYELDDEYEPSAPVVLSGKVTLSVISSMAGGPLSPDEITEAPSLSLDDRAQAENSRGSSRRNLAAEISNAMNEEVKGKTDGKKSSNASSPDMDEYEVIGKGGFECEEDVAADVSLDDYLTATDAELDAEKSHEDTAADISTIDDLKADPLPQDEE